ncbi:hypothetical protein ALC53_09668, partial [Atta colombica]
RIFDIGLSTNISQPSRVFFVTEYFIDQEKYYFLILLHINIALFIGGAAMVATGTMLIAYFKFICGMFKISRKVLSSTSFFIFCIISYNSFCINIKAMKDLLMQLEHICNQMKDKNEVAIINEYNYTARRYTIILTVLVVIVGFFCFIGQYLSNCLTVLPKNISHLPIMMEYFIDQEKYFYLILLHSYAIICIGIVVILATGTMLLTYLQYVCGMFRIARYNVQWYRAPLHIQRMIMFLLQREAKEFTLNVGGVFNASMEFASFNKLQYNYSTNIYSYRIEHAININIQQNITLKNKILMNEGIICAVEIHRQAMKLSKHLLSMFEIMMFCLIVFGVIFLTLNLFRVSFLLRIMIIIYMFLSNHIGQNIIDHNNYVFSTAYNVQWYRAPLRIQRMILFLLQRETKVFTLNIGGLFNASMECFATVILIPTSIRTILQ